MTTARKAKRTKFRRSELLKAIKAFWNGTPVLESTEPLEIRFTEKDFTKAVPEEPGYCVIARACKREHGAKRTQIMQSIAYVERPDENGELKCYRYMLYGKAKKFVVGFDERNVTPHDGTILLSPISPSKRLGLPKVKKPSKSKIETIHIKRPKAKESVNGDGKQKPKKRPRNYSMPLYGHYAARDGRGHVRSVEIETPVG